LIFRKIQRLNAIEKIGVAKQKGGIFLKQLLSTSTFLHSLYSSSNFFAPTLIDQSINHIFFLQFIPKRYFQFFQRYFLHDFVKSLLNVLPLSFNLFFDFIDIAMNKRLKKSIHHNVKK